MPVYLKYVPGSCASGVAKKSAARSGTTTGSPSHQECRLPDVIMSKCRSVTWSRPGAAEPAHRAPLGVVLEGGVVQGEAAFGFGDAKRYGRKGLRDRPHVDSVVRAEPAFDRLGTAAVGVPLRRVPCPLVRRTGPGCQ